MSRTVTLTTTVAGTLTRDAARIARSLGAREVTGSTLAVDASLTLTDLGVAHRLVPATGVTPAQKGAITRRTNARAAARKDAPASTGFMKAYFRARKAGFEGTPAEFAPLFELAQLSA